VAALLLRDWNGFYLMLSTAHIKWSSPLTKIRNFLHRRNCRSPKNCLKERTISFMMF